MASDPPQEWPPRYDESLKAGQAERGWIASEVSHVAEEVSELKSRMKFIERSVISIEQRHDREDAVRKWFGKLIAAFWILVGALAGKALEFFLSNRPIIIAIGASAVLLAAIGFADSSPRGSLAAEHDYVGTDVGPR